MKITKRQLQRIIKEEIQTLNEMNEYEMGWDAFLADQPISDEASDEFAAGWYDSRDKQDADYFGTK